MSKQIGAARQHPKRRRRRIVGALALATAVAVSTASPAFADPPTNSSFETPDVVTGAAVFLAGDTAITGWTIPYGSVDVQEMAGSPWGTAPDGDQVLDLSGSAAGGRGAIQQSFPTVAGTGYTITWNYGALASGSACVTGLERSGTFSVQGSPVIPMTVTDNSTSDPNWQTASTTFTGTGSPVLLQFADTSTNPSAACGLAIDNIQIGIDASVPIVDPEVAAGVLGAAGVAAAGWFVFRRRGGRDAVVTG